MGQRHNRRRTRPRSRNRSSSITNNEFTPIDAFFRPPNPVLPASIDCHDFPAPTWHYGNLTWQARDRTTRLETSHLEAEQCRLFGGEPGDDVGLCYRMLEYFGGLDYIDCPQSLNALPG
ncbi:uncharacterized protein BP01DRAFT_356431 [Aspergillus saccharolyticus JOP 1030-1]|uniref:Uncharacterized protein n=1 Tax=Aspergillus saccharolyticus JOP 1030-1 TaxID=1450539 RepID=A0A318ZMZ5_9EURO|nr:hypothetical protein BP01DRAFT_356431 [Aspergillus saccharolyticus JOP 1030-1]PYH45793.1 hypothetical protein BP01DRAFT_356431 [Aspergillus saccharolyticus JOP 1030-1]